MEVSSMPELDLGANILGRLLSSEGKSIDKLIERAKSPDGRSELASENILPIAIGHVQSFSYPRDRDLLLLSLKFLRNLCAGEILNQNAFIELNGVETVSSVLNTVGFERGSDYGIIRMGIQLLGNVALAGEEHRCAVWHILFPNELFKLARICRRDICDPLCMVLYVCCDENHQRIAELCGDQGLHIVTEIVRTTSEVGNGEDWFELLLSRVCFEEFHFPQLFSALYPADSSRDEELINSTSEPFASQQAYLLKVVSQIMNEQLIKIIVYKDFALSAFQIFRKAVGFNDFGSNVSSNLPTGSTRVDVLGYSLTILRDICSLEGLDVIDSLLESGLLDVLISLLRDLEPPSSIKKRPVIQDVNEEVPSSSSSLKRCPYRGFRRDMVAVIGNCAYGKKHVQDEIREKDALLLLLQQCVTDEDNPFLREWGIWAAKNILEGNAENQRQIAELELQETVDLPELTRLGLRVEIDKETRRTKLVNN